MMTFPATAIFVAIAASVLLHHLMRHLSTHFLD